MWHDLAVILRSANCHSLQLVTGFYCVALLTLCKCRHGENNDGTRILRAARWVEPDVKSQTCRFATFNETTKLCPHCGGGSRWWGWPKPPMEVDNDRPYDATAWKLFSLACQGPVVVWSTFTILDQPPTTPEEAKTNGWDGTNCTLARLKPMGNQALDNNDDTSTRKASSLIRCELDLPGDVTDAERAVQAKTTKCWTCGLCSEGQGCPSELNTWYYDTYTTEAQGCGFEAQKGASLDVAGMQLQGNTKIFLADFRLCNSPGCVDFEVESQKHQDAKKCINGKCET